MGQHIVAVVNNIPGLFLRGVGTFPEGAKWTVETVPEKLIEKALAKDTAMNTKKQIVPVCSFITAEGSIITIDQAYIPRLKVGKPPPPPPPVVEFQSNKKRHEEPPELDDTKEDPEDKQLDDERIIKELEKEENDENEKVVDDSEDEEIPAEEAAPKKKKLKKKLKKIDE